MLKSLRSWIDNGAPTDSREMDVQPGVDWVRVVPFLFVHLACLAVIWVGWSPVAVAVGIGMYLLRAFFVTGFYHRYFSHRTYKTSRPAQFAFAFLGNSAVQRGPAVVGRPPPAAPPHLGPRGGPALARTSTASTGPTWAGSPRARTSARAWS